MWGSFVDEFKNNNVPKIKYDEAQFVHDDDSDVVM